MNTSATALAKSENIKAVETAIAAWNAGDLGRYLNLYDPSLRLHGLGPEPMDKTQVEGFYRMIFSSLGGDDGSLQLGLGEVMETADRIALTFVMSGRHIGQFMGVPATGRAFRMAGVSIMRFERERVIERWTCSDLLSLLVQIEAMPKVA